MGKTKEESRGLRHSIILENMIELYSSGRCCLLPQLGSPRRPEAVWAESDTPTLYPVSLPLRLKTLPFRYALYPYACA